jgi:hypothetical protein
MGQGLMELKPSCDVYIAGVNGFFPAFKVCLKTALISLQFIAEVNNDQRHLKRCRKPNE